MGSKILEWLFLEIVGERSIEELKRRIGRDKSSIIGREALNKTIEGNEDYLRLLNCIREKREFEVKDISKIRKNEIYDVVSAEVDRKLFDEFFESLERNYRDILSEEAARNPEVEMILERVQKLESENKKNISNTEKNHRITRELGKPDEEVTGRVPYRGNGLSRIRSLAPPRPSYNLIGRDSILRDLKQRLFAGDDVAIHGLPGVGKTALAVELAHDPEVQQHFQDGILWAGLGRRPDILSHLSTWGAHLSIHPDEMVRLLSIEDKVKALRGAIGMRRMLLVIDDAWEINDALTLKLGCPNCVHVVTTRKPEVALYFADEVTQIHELDITGGLELLANLSKDSVDAEPNKAEELVHAVGGLPLALIIMGSYLRVKAYSGQPRRLHNEFSRLLIAKERLKAKIPKWPDYFPSLSEESFISLVAVICISDEALDESSRRALRALSVFPPKPNSFSEEAALAVSAENIEALDELTDYGLLEGSGPGRFTLHKVIADYAGLNSINESGAHERMAEFFVDYVDTHKKDYDMLEKETTNIYAALKAAFEQKMQTAVLRVANAFFYYLDTRGLYEIAGIHLNRALQAARSLDDDAGLMTTLLNLGEVASRRGNYSEAEKYYQEGLLIAQNTNCTEKISNFLIYLGFIVFFRGNYIQAKEYFSEALSLARNIRHDENIADLLAGLGLLAYHHGEYTQAEEYSKEGLALARETKYYFRMSWFLDMLSMIKRVQGDYEKAEEYCQEGLTLVQEIGHSERISTSLMNLGILACYHGDYAKAEEYCQEGLTLVRKIGHSERISNFLMNLGAFAFFQGNYIQAEDYLREGLKLARETGVTSGIIDLLTNLGELELRRGNYTKAEEYLQEALDLGYKTGDRRSVHYDLMVLGALELRRGNYTKAEVYLQEGLALAREIGDVEGIMDLLNNLGELEIKRGNYTQAEEYLQEGLTLARETGHCRGIRDSLTRMGELDLRRGHCANAEQLLQEGLALARRIGHGEGIMDLLKNLGELEIRRGNYTQAKEYLQKGLTLARKIGYSWFTSAILNEWGELQLRQQELESASAAFLDALQVAKKLGGKELTALALYGLARVASALHNSAEAHRYSQESLEILENIGHYEKNNVKQWITKAQ